MPVGIRIDVCIYVCVWECICVCIYECDTHFHTNIGHILRVYRVNWMVVGGRCLDGWIVGRRGGRMAKRVQSLATVWMLAKLFPRWKGCICTQILNTVTVILRRLMGSWKLHFVKKSFLWHRCVRRPLILIYLGFSFATEQETLRWIDINVK